MKSTSNNLTELYKKLGVINKKEFVVLKKNNILIQSINDINVSPRYISALKNMDPESIFLLKNEPFMLFFNLENISDPAVNVQNIHRQSWNFDKAPIIIISTPSEIIFYNAFNFDTKGCFLEKLTDNEKDFEDFSYENIYSGKLFSKYNNYFNDTKRLNRCLLKYITEYRNKLVKIQHLPSLIANKLLARVIFLRYLKDREISINEIKNFNFIDSFATKTKLYELFHYLKIEFNGDLFDVTTQEKKLITNEHLNSLKNFFSDIDSSGQIYLIPFDFSIIPIELVSNIYENFLNEKKKENKSYYTPTFLVDYMVNKTVSQFLENKTDSNCKVLDPACGSGIFLVEALRKIIQKEEVIKQVTRLTASRLTELAKNNIFGIDKDDNAINIAIFSLYITLLDYQEPKSILKLKFPNLKNRNFFKSDFFSKNKKFNIVINKIKPDFILANPPYGSEESAHIDWCKKNEVPFNNKQIAQSFLARAKDFCSSNTIIAMLVTSRILYNVNAIEFRKYFLLNFKIDEILELSAVRQQIFSGVNPAVSIIFYKQNMTKDNKLKTKLAHISIKPNLFFKFFKTLLIEKNDINVVEQSLLYNYDWLWKVLIYGNILDFHFINRIKNNYQTIQGNSNLYYGQGIIDSPGSNNSEHLKKYYFLDTGNKEFQKFFIFNHNKKFNKNSVHRARKEDLFIHPMALVKRGVTSDLSCVSAFSDRSLVFTDSVFSIKSITNDIVLLKSVVAILNSNLVNYLILNTSVSAGMERNEIKETDLVGFPLNEPIQELSDIVDSLQKSSKVVRNNNVLFDEKSKSEICECNFDYNDPKFKKLNSIVEKLFNISETEKDLMDYALNISIPILKFGHNISNQPKAFSKVTNKQLEDYAEVFCENFEQDYKYFNVDIYTFANYSLMNFKARLNKKNIAKINIINDSALESTIKKITSLSVSRITNEIFIKKDMKGFNTDSFFVIKTNEYKNWHRAIARLDVNEFSNAIWGAEIALSNRE